MWPPPLGSSLGDPWAQHESTARPGTWTTTAPLGMLQMLTRLSIPTLTHHRPGRRQRGPGSKLAAEGEPPGELGHGETPGSLTSRQRGSSP